MNYGLSARAYAISANMLEDTEHEKWERLGLSEGDTMLASALVVTFLRITSIECGLRHLLQREGIKPGRGKGKHDLLAFWNRLPNECRQRIATACAAPESEVRTTLEHYRSGSVALRYGGPTGRQNAGPPNAAAIRRDVNLLQKLANALGGRAHAPIHLQRVEPEHR